MDGWIPQGERKAQNWQCLRIWTEKKNLHLESDGLRCLTYWILVWKVRRQEKPERRNKKPLLKTAMEIQHNRGALPLTIPHVLPSSSTLRTHRVQGHLPGAECGLMNPYRSTPFAGKQ
jgi:hypothetical protein